MCEEEWGSLSEEARENQWGVRFYEQGAAYRKERLVIFKQDRVGGRNP